MYMHNLKHVIPANLHPMILSAKLEHTLTSVQAQHDHHHHHSNQYNFQNHHKRNNHVHSRTRLLLDRSCVCTIAVNPTTTTLRYLYAEFVASLLGRWDCSKFNETNTSPSMPTACDPDPSVANGGCISETDFHGNLSQPGQCVKDDVLTSSNIRVSFIFTSFWFGEDLNHTIASLRRLHAVTTEGKDNKNSSGNSIRVDAMVIENGIWDEYALQKGYHTPKPMDDGMKMIEYFTGIQRTSTQPAPPLLWAMFPGKAYSKRNNIFLARFEQDFPECVPLPRDRLNGPPWPKSLTFVKKSRMDRHSVGPIVRAHVQWISNLLCINGGLRE
eukprot:TRINITY_DN1041_c0_g1_i1.p1 TRINITY_DN1041_c0_g1~~TRINITY_DN1041_c0_g1_i1.p1  ORF type:complete len:328 (+),score=-2.69 TRINITY_DN1041_c0_g1_i1:204-1187(+)